MGNKIELVHGTLALLILKTLAAEPMHPVWNPADFQRCATGWGKDLCIRAAPAGAARHFTCKRAQKSDIVRPCLPHVPTRARRRTRFRVSMGAGVI
jgi:hypothetical protein